jgi:hypothetical protein
VIGALAADAPGAADLAALADALEPGATYRVPAAAAIVADVASAAREDVPVRVDVIAGGDGDEDRDRDVSDTDTDTDRGGRDRPRPRRARRHPLARLAGSRARRAGSAARFAVSRDPLPSAVALTAPEGRATLVPRPPPAGDGDGDQGAALAAFADAVADLEGASSRAARAAAGVLFAGAATRPAVPGFGDSEACVADVLVAESACLPVLERVADVFELDLGWRACCERVRAVAEEGCYCDGAAARALETSSRADAHRRVVDAVRGACGLDVAAASRREACPLVRVSTSIATSIATTNSTVSEPDADPKRSAW